MEDFVVFLIFNENIIIRSLPKEPGIRFTLHEFKNPCLGLNPRPAD